jgi:hypothetical protein
MRIGLQIDSMPLDPAVADDASINPTSLDEAGSHDADGENREDEEGDPEHSPHLKGQQERQV